MVYGDLEDEVDNGGKNGKSTSGGNKG